jgi:uncharacterized protein YhaN
MEVKNLHVDGFGVWTELDLQALSPRVTIVFGANETGKTTLMQFIRSMLYGFSPERRNRYLPPVHGGRAGGEVDIDAAHGGLHIQRHLDQFGLADEEESLVVRSADGATVSVSLLSHLLAGVDEATFNNVFSVGLRELQELGTLDDTKAADLLYKLTTGLDRVSLFDVMRDLSDVRQSLFDPHDEASAIPVLLQRRDQLQQRMAALHSEGQQWVTLQSDLVGLDGEARELEQRAAQWDQQLKVLEVTLRVRDLWVKRRALSAELDAIGQLREVPDTALKRLETLRETGEEYERELAELQRRRREFRREVAAQPVNRALWAQAAHIEALAELAPWIATLQAEVDQTRVEASGLETRLSASANKLGLRDEKGHQTLPELSPRALATLQRPARAVRAETQRLKQAQAEHVAAKQQLDELSAQLEAALLDRGHDDLAKAVETAGASVTQLRRRAQLDTRLEQLTQQWESQQHEHRDLLEEQVLSPATLIWLGVPFVVGVALLIGGFVWSRAAMLGWPVAVLGLCGWVAAVVAKITMERAAARELEECENQLDALKTQLQQVKKEQADLDAQLPRGNGAVDARLATAEKQLAGLEELLPLEANLQTVRQKATTTKRRVEQVEAALKEARARWRGALRQLQLPEDMSPQEVKRLANGTQQVVHTRHHLDNRRDELTARERELKTLTARINKLAEEVELKYASHDPQVQLQRLSAALAEQQTLFERRQQLRQEDRQIRRQIRQLTGELHKARAERRSIIASAGVRTESELKELLARLAHRRSVASELQQTTGQYTGALGKDSPVERVEAELSAHTESELEQLRNDLMRQTTEARAQLARLHQRRGALAQQSQSLVTDRRLPELKLQLGCVLQQLDESVQRWRVLSVAAQVLEVVREVYETQRQPQTLQDASRYFATLTEGQYVRIWTPLTDMSLRVDLATGESLALDVLSSGTREAVFLSLRLALVADFTRRGIMLPLILDDVLVNFDRRRAHAAAQVLCDFAQHGHQVLLFTCHEHIVELFSQRQVEIRCLSGLSILQHLETEVEAETRAAEPEPVPAEVHNEEPPAAAAALEGGDYELGDEEHVLQPPPPEYLLNPPVAQAEIDTDLDDEPFDDMDVCDDGSEYYVADIDDHDDDAEATAKDAAPDPQSVQRRPMQQRFTWESPERYRSNEAA